MPVKQFTFNAAGTATTINVDALANDIRIKLQDSPVGGSKFTIASQAGNWTRNKTIMQNGYTILAIDHTNAGMYRISLTSGAPAKATITW